MRNSDGVEALVAVEKEDAFMNMRAVEQLYGGFRGRDRERLEAARLKWEERGGERMVAASALGRWLAEGGAGEDRPRMKRALMIVIVTTAKRARIQLPLGFGGLAGCFEGRGGIPDKPQYTAGARSLPEMLPFEVGCDTLHSRFLWLRTLKEEARWADLAAQHEEEDRRQAELDAKRNMPSLAQRRKLATEPRVVMDADGAWLNLPVVKRIYGSGVFDDVALSMLDRSGLEWEERQGEVVVNADALYAFLAKGGAGSHLPTLKGVLQITTVSASEDGKELRGGWSKERILPYFESRGIAQRVGLPAGSKFEDMLPMEIGEARGTVLWIRSLKGSETAAVKG